VKRIICTILVVLLVASLTTGLANATRFKTGFDIEGLQWGMNAEEVNSLLLLRGWRASTPSQPQPYASTIYLGVSVYKWPVDNVIFIPYIHPVLGMYVCGYILFNKDGVTASNEKVNQFNNAEIEIIYTYGLPDEKYDDVSGYLKASIWNLADGSLLTLAAGEEQILIDYKSADADEIKSIIEREKQVK